MSAAPSEGTSVLFLAPIAPARGGNGLAMRAGMLLEAIAPEVPVDVVVVPVSGPANDLEWIAGMARTVRVIRPVDASRSGMHLAAQLADERLRGLLNKTAPLPLRASAAPPTLAGDIVRGIPASTDLVAVLAMRSYLAPLGAEVARRLRAPRLVVDLDDDDEAVLRSLGEHAEAEAIGRLAAAWLPGADVVLTASAVDADAVRGRYGLDRVVVVPNAMCPVADPPPLPGRGRLLFVGNLTYRPNLEAVSLLVEEILPRVRRACPAVTLKVIGPSAPGSLDEVADFEGVTVAGFVPDLGPSYASADVVVVPLLHGAGTRIKVLEAFAHCRPVVATPVAVEGLDVRDGEDVLLADGPEALAHAIVTLLDDPARAAALAERAGRTLARCYVPSVVGPKVRRAVLPSRTEAA
jgi:glycosyltransferase involved in cell wall biosynthesis